MKQVMIQQGKAVLEEIPAPMVEANTIVVRTNHSCVSIGTEMSGLRSSGVPIWRRAMKSPRKIKKAMVMVAQNGFSATHSLIKRETQRALPTGYSAAGVVLEVGEGIMDIQPGERIACAGAQCAHHAEIIRVPRNLAVRIPEKLNSAEASTVTLGAIALQGVRRAQPTLGETFVVIGLGILGQLTTQILQANGCRVIGTDLDKRRLKLAQNLGMEFGIFPEDGIDIEHVARLTEGVGADGVLITAATPSHEVVSTAFQMCRKKGRVVLVGDVGLNLNRADFYQKELDFFISTSYGPGRYDNKYEEKGMDYPVAYMRWTENRNMGEYLRLLAEGKVNVGQLIEFTYNIEDVSVAYDSLKSGEDSPLMVILSYPEGTGAKISRKLANPIAKPVAPGRIRIALAGAGGFAKAMHLPNLIKLSTDYHLQAVMSRTGHNASTTAKQFGAIYSTTDYQQVLNDSDIDAVIISTRHNLHASMLLGALKARKHVLVEKPMVLTRDELKSIENFFSSTSSNDPKPLLLTGFNRRFSIFSRKIYEIVRNRNNPMILDYTMNAGYIPLDHWIHGDEGGGRNIGEACHIYDLFVYLTSSKATKINAFHISSTNGYYSHRDNFIASICFEDGSVANLIYTALGAKDHPKENLKIFVDGKVLLMDDYRSLTISGAEMKSVVSKYTDKGHKDMLQAFADAIKNVREWPIPLWQQIQATEISFEIEKQICNSI